MWWIFCKNIIVMSILGLQSCGSGTYKADLIMKGTLLTNWEGLGVWSSVTQNIPGLNKVIPQLKPHLPVVLLQGTVILVPPEVWEY